MQTLSKAILFITLTLQASNAFHVFSATKAVAPRHTDVSYLMGMAQPDDYGDEHSNDGSLDFDAVREKLESLVGGDGLVEQLALSSNGPSLLEKSSEPISNPIDDEIFIPEASPLTTIERERRETEIAILKHLSSQGDEVLSDLWTFWYQERGSKAAARLLQAEALSTQKETWKQAEDILLELIDLHGVHWVEPVNRLATLYYLQGRLQESEKLALTVLKVKPWHFGALSGIVMIYAGMNSSEKARQWAARRLPTLAPLGPNRRRQQWVERAVDDATESLVQAEKRLKSIFGAVDQYPLRTLGDFDRFEEDNDAWQ